jgi:hypothetical protein
MSRKHTIRFRIKRKIRVVGGRSWRLLTSAQRLLPGFIIIGAQKAGTTALLYYLRQHPMVVKSIRKNEVHFFDRHFEEGVRGYRACFPLKSKLPEGGICGEASPEYILHPHAARRIAGMLPDVKLIAVLRDPVKRALSQYFMEIRRGRETLPFEEALRVEDERTEPEWQRLLADEYHSARRLEVHAYKRRGRYAEQLKRYFEHFDRGQMLILGSDELAGDTAGTLERVCRFLGIASMPAGIDLSRRNVGAPKGAYRSANEMPPGVIQGLREYFKPHNRELYSLLDRDFGW